MRTSVKDLSNNNLQWQLWGIREVMCIRVVQRNDTSATPSHPTSLSTLNVSGTLVTESKGLFDTEQWSSRTGGGPAPVTPSPPPGQVTREETSSESLNVQSPSSAPVTDIPRVSGRLLCRSASINVGPLMSPFFSSLTGRLRPRSDPVLLDESPCHGEL